MIRISDTKTILKGVLATAALVAAMAIPASAAMANDSCPSVRSDPTQAQYCSVSAADEGGSNTPNNNVSPENNAGNEGGTEGVSAESVSTPVETTAVESSSSSSLPFTGLDVGVLALVALALVGTGVLLRRLTRSGELGS